MSAGVLRAVTAFSVMVKTKRYRQQVRVRLGLTVDMMDLRWSMNAPLDLADYATVLHDGVHPSLFFFCGSV
jgi:hypothetical protein|tara:strand:- start:8865 stop:9077 length:213 start_codon:yes stop_codon:yes gene_type:complete